MNLSNYLKTMKNLPDRFSNLAFWRGVRKLKDEMVKTFEYVEEWGTSVEGEIDALTLRLNKSFTVVEHTIQIKRPSDLIRISQGISESNVPYPRVDNFMVIFTISDPSITNADIIESAAFNGILAMNNRGVTFNHLMPLTPVNDGSNIHLIFYPLPMYMENSNYSIENGSMTIYIRCRRIATAENG